MVNAEPTLLEQTPSAALNFHHTSASPLTMYSPIALENLVIIRLQLQRQDHPSNIHELFPKTITRLISIRQLLHPSPRYPSLQQANNPDCYNSYKTFICNWNFPSCDSQNSSKPVCLTLCYNFFSDCQANS